MEKISGIVISGKKKGRDLGFPTANIILDKKAKSGVYSGTVFIGNKQYKSAIFIGIDGKILEAHILDFSDDLYDKKIKVAIGEKIRDVRKFDSASELMKQIGRDIEIIKNKR